jgi:acyl-CoA thioester hydrolase
MIDPRSHHTWETTAGPDTIDERGHVSNVAYVRWFQDAARAHSEARGWDESAYERLGALFVVRRHQIDYLRPVLEGQRLAITTTVTGWRGASATRHTTIVRLGDNHEVARGETQWVLVTHPEGRPTRIPLELREAFGAPAA